MHFNNIQCTIIKKGIISVVYVEDKKRSEPVKNDDDDDDDDDDDELFLWYGWPMKGIALFPSGTIVRDSHYHKCPTQMSIWTCAELSSGFDEWSCAVVITTTSWYHQLNNFSKDASL